MLVLVAATFFSAEELDFTFAVFLICWIFDDAAESSQSKLPRLSRTFAAGAAVLLFAVDAIFCTLDRRGPSVASVMPLSTKLTCVFAICCSCTLSSDLHAVKHSVISAIVFFKVCHIKIRDHKIALRCLDLKCLVENCYLFRQL